MDELIRDATFGEKLIDLASTKATDMDAYKLKRYIADLIDMLHAKYQASNNAEFKELCSDAITKLLAASIHGTEVLKWQE